MFKKIILLFVCVLFSTWGFAQSFLGWQLHDRYFSIYAGTGWTGYMGDLTNGNPMTDGLSHFNVGVEARLLTRIAARVQFAQYKLEGSDKNATDSSYNRQRNLSFHSKNYEWQVEGVYYFLKYRGKYHKRRTYEPYIAAGIGQTFYNPKADHTDINEVTNTYDLRSMNTETETYGSSAWIIPVNFGVKAALNEFLNLSLDLGYRFAFTGHLDDVYGHYAGPYPDGSIEASLSNRKDEVPEINQEAYDALVPGAQRGNGKNDGYFLVNINLELYLPQDLFKSKNGRRRKEKILGKPSAYD
ncbi:DUF6089 family protein [Reichenbachiella carrageenanivorans]|uniref:DUF6089 family protein n=1 Tax=Reichenbachiella carrageenanivorans TaxID=2979869 RepID=A0ABY6CZL3_9BACT|nr:DUF6089 family protein [Reichenbachiella carrageenanivorans]UXX79345.1 DUF6089 family protein [Reichenbachiella carrageenanivorans]